MSIALVEKEVARFLATPDPEVLCLKGKWGVGKTYSWNAFLDAAKSEKRIALSSYSYVSLFGRNSLGEVRYAIFENSVATESIGVAPSVDSFKSNTIAVVDRLGRKSFGLLGSLPIARDYVTAFQSVSFLSVKEKLVCFDDLERKGHGLPMKDLFGLISELRDQKHCKVVLILNEDAFDAADRADYNKFHEKVIDISLEFAPDANDCVRIALKGNGPAYDLMRAAVVKLEISNIRIVKRIERLALRAAPLVAKFDPAVLKQAVESIVLLAWSLYAKDSAPSLEFLRKRRGKGLFGVTNEANLAEEEKAWESRLDEYGFRIMDEFDVLLLEGIERGYFNEAKLISAARSLDDQHKAGHAQATLHASWRLYHDSFDNNEAEVVQTILNGFREHVTLVTPPNLDGMVRLLKKLGHTEEAKEAIAFYLDRRSDPAESFNLAEIPFSDEITDPDVRGAFDEKYRSFKDERSPRDVLIQIAESQGWTRKNMILLSRVTADDFYTMFKSEHGTDLTKIVQTCLKFGATENADAEMRGIAERAKEALVRIGRESSINQVRVTSKYRVDLEQ